jgi:hypothetical protein
VTLTGTPGAFVLLSRRPQPGRTGSGADADSGRATVDLVPVVQGTFSCRSAAATATVSALVPVVAERSTVAGTPSGTICRTHAVGQVADGVNGPRRARAGQRSPGQCLTPSLTLTTPPSALGSVRARLAPRSLPSLW